MGIVFSAFAWTYALAQIPGGLFLDRFWHKVTYLLVADAVVAVYVVSRHGDRAETLLLCRFGQGSARRPVSR